MQKVTYVAYLEFSDGGMSFVGDDFESADEAEQAARVEEGLLPQATYVKLAHGGVKAIMVRESREVRVVEL